MHILLYYSWKLMIIKALGSLKPGWPNLTGFIVLRKSKNYILSFSIFNYFGPKAYKKSNLLLIPL